MISIISSAGATQPVLHWQASVGKLARAPIGGTDACVQMYVLDVEKYGTQVCTTGLVGPGFGFTIRVRVRLLTSTPTTDCQSDDGPRARALHRTRTGTLYLFPTLSVENPAVSLSLGSGDECHVRIDDDDNIAKVHCFLVCTRDSITLRRFKDHPVTINNVKMAEGEVELSVHNVITLSETSELVVCDERLSPQPELTVVDLGEFVRRAQELYKNPSQAARSVNVPRQTFVGWIENKRFVKPMIATVALCVALGGGYAFMSPGSDEREQPAPLPAASTSVDTAPVETTSPDESVTPQPDTEESDASEHESSNAHENDDARMKPESTDKPRKKRRRINKRTREDIATPGRIEEPDKPTFKGGEFGTGPRFLGGQFDSESEGRLP